MTAALDLDFEHCYRAVVSRDARFDGVFIVGVTSTGIYCRPSCPAPVRPHRRNVAFYPTAAAAQRTGLRACRRCLPDAVPGSPAWDLRGDLAGRAARLIADGYVDRAGVEGLARHLSVSERHLHRVLVERLGATPIQLARARRAQTARLLIETTALAFSEIAFASGFSSIRQFNDTFRSVFAATPSELRRRSRRSRRDHAEALSLRLPFRTPFRACDLLAWLDARHVTGLEELAAGRYRRTLRLPGGPATVLLEPRERHVELRVILTQLRDLATAVERCRRLLDLDADPHAVAEVLTQDPVLAPQVGANPGMRVAGTVDGAELGFRAVLGQQVSVQSARRLAGRLTAMLGGRLIPADGSLTRRFPTPATVAAAPPHALGLPASRAGALQQLAAVLDSGALTLDPGTDRAEATRALTAIPGIGPWTVEYIRMRALRDPDAFPAIDRALRRGAEALGLPTAPRALLRHAERWRPWRAYAAHYLWAAAAGGRRPDPEDPS